MPWRVQSPRERAARALCEMHGHPPDIVMDGRPMWQSFLSEVDTVLRAALSEDDWGRLILSGWEPLPAA